MTEAGPWQALAAYLYVLGLDDVAMAWEYLRRNPEYRAAWSRRRRGKAPSHWGLAAFENPDHDAREADPLWLEDCSALSLVPAPTPIATARFDLWRLPGTKHLIHDGRTIRATLLSPGRALRVHLSPLLRRDRPYAYQLLAGSAARDRRRETAATIDSIEAPPRVGSAAPVQRSALVRMRTLIALDAEAAGASHREIAAALFGAERTVARWSDDGELRAQIRYLIARGRSFVTGGYRVLLHAEPGERRGRAKSPS